MPLTEEQMEAVDFNSLPWVQEWEAGCAANDRLKEMIHRQNYTRTIGKLTICWFDLWTNKYGLEISWNARKILQIGF